MSMRLTVHSCEDMKDVDSWGKNDPYCIVRDEHGMKVKTKYKSNAGASCVWNETFDIPEDSHEITFTVKDKGFFRNTLIGENVIAKSDIGTRTTVPLFNNGKPTGSLLVSIEAAEEAPAPPPAAAQHVQPHAPAPAQVIMHHPPPPPAMVQPGVMPYGYPPAAPAYGHHHPPPPPHQGLSAQEAILIHEAGKKKGKKEKKKEKKELKKALKKMKKLF